MIHPARNYDADLRHNFGQDVSYTAVYDTFGPKIMTQICVIISGRMYHTQPCMIHPAQNYDAYLRNNFGEDVSYTVLYDTFGPKIMTQICVITLGRMYHTRPCMIHPARNYDADPRHNFGHNSGQDVSYTTVYDTSALKLCRKSAP